MRAHTLALAVLGCVGHVAEAFPTDYGLYNTTWPFEDYAAAPLEIRQNDKVALRIMPLGASIMEGVGSTHHSG